MPVGLFSIPLHLLFFNQSEIKSSANQYKTQLEPELNILHDLTTFPREKIL